MLHPENRRVFADAAGTDSNGAGTLSSEVHRVLQEFESTCHVALSGNSTFSLAASAQASSGKVSVSLRIEVTDGYLIDLDSQLDQVSLRAMGESSGRSAI